MKQHGFTLIEILIALVIFAILSVLAARALQTVTHLDQALKKADEVTSQQMLTMTLLRRDFANVIDRPVRNNPDTLTPSFLANKSDIIFTRQESQGKLQRVGYALQNGALVRLTWEVLDSVDNTPPDSRILWKDINSIEWQYVASNGQKSAQWPLPKELIQQGQGTIGPLPVTVLMVMHTKMGVVQGVFPIPARGAMGG